MKNHRMVIFHCIECTGSEDPCVLMYKQTDEADVPESCPMSKIGKSVEWKLINPLLKPID